MPVHRLHTSQSRETYELMLRTVPTLAPHASAVRFGLQTSLIYENLRDVSCEMSYKKFFSESFKGLGGIFPLQNLHNNAKLSLWPSIKFDAIKLIQDIQGVHYAKDETLFS